MIWWILYLVPMILCFLHAYVSYKNDLEETDLAIKVAICPLLNWVGVYGEIESIIKYDNHKDAYRNTFTIPCCNRLSTESREQIKASKEHLKVEIERLKNEHKITVQEIKQEDEQKVLLGKLGLTLEDLVYMKERK